MANFSNLKEIFDESRTDPAIAAGDQLLAIALRGRVEVATWKKAAEILAGTGLPELPPEPAQPVEPAPGSPQPEIDDWLAAHALWQVEHEAWNAEIAVANQQRNELVGWAQRIIGGDPLKLLLAASPQAMSKVDLLGLTDAQAAAAMNILVERLAKGLRPGR